MPYLPELVGKWFTRQKTSLDEEQTAHDQQSQSDVSNENEVWYSAIVKRVKTMEL